jgi:wyosine [tRNA(Phe)-imidazoG37] synthetase (radical SAM superfamily)
MPQVIQFLFQALRDLATFWENIKLCHVQLDNVTFYGVSELVLVTSKMIHWVDIQLFATVEKVETLFQLIRFDTRCRISVLQWLKAVIFIK